MLLSQVGFLERLSAAEKHPLSLQLMVLSVSFQVALLWLEEAAFVLTGKERAEGRVSKDKQLPERTP